MQHQNTEARDFLLWANNRISPQCYHQTLWAKEVNLHFSSKRPNCQMVKSIKSYSDLPQTVNIWVFFMSFSLHCQVPLTKVFLLFISVLTKLFLLLSGRQKQEDVLSLDVAGLLSFSSKFVSQSAMTAKAGCSKRFIINL